MKKNQIKENVNATNWQKFLENEDVASYYENYFREYYEDLYRSVILTVTTGGSSGGSCYGTYTAEYHIDSEDQKRDLFNDLKSKVSSLFDLNYAPKAEDALKELIEDVFYNPASDYSDGGDYYGNYSKTDIYLIKFSTILDKLNDLGVVDNYDFCKNETEEILSTRTEVYKIKTQKKKLDELIEKQKSFEVQKEKDLMDLNKTLKAEENRVRLIQEKISRFDETKKSELNKLKKEIKSLETELGINESSKKKFK